MMRKALPLEVCIYPLAHKICDIQVSQQARNHNLRSDSFRLPIELRNLIFEFVWDNERDVIFRYRGITIIAKTPSNTTRCRWPIYKNGVPYGLPKWLLASRDILHDAITMFHRTRFFELITDPFCSRYKDTKMRHHSMYCRHVGWPAFPNPLIFNSNIRKTSNYLLSTVVSEWSNKLRVYWNTCTEKQMFMFHLKNVSAKNLQLHLIANVLFVCRHGMDAYYRHRIYMPLETLGNSVREITLKLKCCDMANTVYHRSLDAAVDAAGACARNMFGSRMRIVQEAATYSIPGMLELTVRYKRGV
jgi:hypothetical protein